MTRTTLTRSAIVLFVFGLSACESAQPQGQDQANLTTVQEAILGDCNDLPSVPNSYIVSMRGSAQGNGTLASPYDMATGILAAVADNKRIAACTGSYVIDNVYVDADVEIYGSGLGKTAIVSSRPKDNTAIELDANATISLHAMIVVGSNATSPIMGDGTVVLGSDAAALPGVSTW